MTIQQTDFRNMLRERSFLLWDTDIEKLDMDLNHRYIISRLLCKGGMPGYLWVVNHYPEDAITDTVIHRRDMDPIVRNFMAEQYHIPRDRFMAPGSMLSRQTGAISSVFSERSRRSSSHWKKNGSSVKLP